MSVYSPPKDPYDAKNSYSVLVPRQFVDFKDIPYNPLTSGEVIRRVPFPRNMFQPAWDIAVQGTVKPCKRPRGIKYYYPLAKVKLGIGRAFRAFYDPDTDEYSREMGTDARADVALQDDSKKVKGYLYGSKCHGALMLVTIREPSNPDKVRKVGYCFLSHKSNLP